MSGQADLATTAVPAQAGASDRPRGRDNLLSSGRLMGGGLLLAAILAAAMVGLVTYQLQEDRHHAQERHELLARVLEDHAARTIDLAALATASVIDAARGGESLEVQELQRVLRESLSNKAPLRAMAVVAPDGRILGAAGTVAAGGTVDLDRLGPMPAPGRAMLLSVQPGRGLPLKGSEEPAPSGLSVLPFARTWTEPGGRVLHVLALLNPDAFANFQEQTLNDPRLAAALVDFDGRLVASTANARGATDLKGLPPLKTFLPATERASWSGDGLLAGQRLASFRALRQHPLWVMVESDRADVRATTSRRVSWFVGAGGAVIVFTLLLTWALSRTQRDRERAQAERDEAQAALAARGRELDVVFASVRELLFRTDAQGCVQLINPRWELSSGRPMTEAIGRPLASLVAPESRETVARLFEADPDGLPKHGEAVIQGLRHLASRFEMTVVPLFERGQLLGFAGSAVDMTELLATQSQLRAQLDFNASMIESNPLPVSVRDIRNRYVRVNKAWEDFTGRSRDRIIGTLASLTQTPLVARMHESRDRELLAQGRGEVHYEAQMQRADGQLRDVFVSKSLILGADGQPFGIVGTFMDISEIREAERATRQARDAAEQASSAKSEFIANISHELRTPLQSILGFSEIGSRRAEALPRMAAMFDDIHRAGQRMLALVNDLLDLSKLDRKGISLEMLRQDVRPVVRDVVAEVNPLAQAKSIPLRLRSSPAPLVANIDAARLAQVVRNLLANAIRFSPANEPIDIGLDIQPREAGDIELRVADRGPGVPPDELELIFDPFVQSSKTKDGSGGTGLGLAISRRIVSAHGGTIRAENREDGGATFVVTLPATRFGDTRPLQDI